MKPILEEQRNEMEQLRNDSSMSRDDKLAKMRDLHEQSSNQIKAISTATSKRNSTKFSRNAKPAGNRVNPKIAKSLLHIGTWRALEMLIGRIRFVSAATPARLTFSGKMVSITNRSWSLFLISRPP